MKLIEMRDKFLESVRIRINEAIGMPEMGQIDSDDYKYRSLTDTNTKRDLNPITQERMQDIAVYLMESTPMGKRLMEFNKDYIIGEGIKYSAVDGNVQQILNNFWFDPINNFEISQYARAMELSLFGEQFWPTWVNPVDGAVKLGCIDPKQVKEVTRNPLNPVQLIDVKTSTVLAPVTGAGEDYKPKDTYKIIDMQRDIAKPNYGRMEGEIFFFAINKLTNGTRGRSDLLSIADWIDVHETFLFNMAERAKLITAFIWDVTFEGWSQEKIDEYVKTKGIKMPKPGSVRYHNEKLKWDAVTPKLEASDNSETARTIKNHIASGYGIPPFWLGEGDQTTRATALEMNSPTYKHFKARQFYFKYIISYVFDYVIDQAIIHKQLDGKVNRSFSIFMQPLAERDFTLIAASMVQIATALQVAKDNGWVTDKQAKDFFAHVAGMTGMDISTLSDDDVLAQEQLKKLAEQIRESKGKK